MSTQIPPIELSRILQTNSSPETIAVLLNEAEERYFRLQRKPHGNAKRVYPFWKICEVCSKPYQCHNHTQAHRNHTCSPECWKATLARRKGKLLGRRANWLEVSCAHCGKTVSVREKQIQKSRQTFCSRSCRAKAHAVHLLPYCANGKGKKRPGKGLAMDANPAWKGGVTYFKTKGNYVGVKYVRCPTEFLPMARKDGYVMEHRLIVAQSLGRPLKRSEVVHHINHDPTDNRLENLQLFQSNSAHKRYEGEAASASQ